MDMLLMEAPLHGDRTLWTEVHGFWTYGFSDLYRGQSMAEGEKSTMAKLAYPKTPRS